VLRLLRAESLDAHSREIGQPPSKISEWRENSLLGGGEELMKAPSRNGIFRAVRGHVAIHREAQISA
jgi:hypothetical protein